MAKARKLDRAKALPLILDRIAAGQPLASIARELGLGRQTVYNWIEQEEVSAQLRVARGAGADTLALEALEIMDKAPERYSTECGTRIDPAYVAWQKQRAEARMKLAAVFDPGRYGQRAQLEHTGKDGGPISTVTEFVLAPLTAE